MSEYQYYEFAAIDEPLTAKQMEKLRAISSRAEITSTSFSNEYHFGDLRGNPSKVVAEFFDAGLYYANFGSLRCLFRLPKDAVDLRLLKQFQTEQAIKVEAKGKHVIVDIYLNDEPGTYDVPYDQTLESLIPARTSLLEGNLSPLYVSWLAAVQRYLVENQVPEPCPPADRGQLDAGAQALADFFCVDPTLLKAIYGSTAKKIRIDKPSEIAKWARSLPVKEKDEYLASFISEAPTIVRSKLLKQYRASQKTASPATIPAPSRTAGELRAAAGMESLD